MDLSGFTGVVVNVDQAKAVTLTGDGSFAIDDTASKVRALEGDVDNAHLLADAATVTAKEADFDDAIHFTQADGLYDNSSVALKIELGYNASTKALNDFLTIEEADAYLATENSAPGFKLKDTYQNILPEDGQPVVTGASIIHAVAESVNDAVALSELGADGSLVSSIAQYEFSS